MLDLKEKQAKYMNYLWHGPPHDRTVSCSFADKLL